MGDLRGDGMRAAYFPAILRFLHTEPHEGKWQQKKQENDNDGKAGAGYVS